VGCFGGHGVPKVSQQPGESEEIPCEGRSRDPLETERAATAEWLERFKACIQA